LIDGLAIVSILIVGYAAFARRLAGRSITMPMVFVVGGYLLGPDAFGVLELSPDTESIKSLVELTLVLLLFADAATLNFAQLRHDVRLPGRLLGIGLPLTLALGGLAAYVFYSSEGLAFALLVGAILAPTDAALGMAIFSNPRIPTRIRRALNVESGLNDGIAAPFVTLFIAYAASSGPAHHSNWFTEAAKEIGLAVLVAIAVGVIGGALLTFAHRRGWTSEHLVQLGIAGLAATSYFCALAIHGNGFVAAFLGGLIFGAATRGNFNEETEFTESSGTLLSLIVWVVFGAVLVTVVLGDDGLDARAILLALVSLTVVRMLPVALALLGTGMRHDTVLLMGWFGPRGLASVVFTLLAVSAFDEAGRDSHTLIEVATWTILLSVIAHGISAGPLANLYARRLDAARATQSDLAELEHVPEPRERRKMVA
jgi:NhaP-type Na+/H+ or K+/H+ antiporter